MSERFVYACQVGDFADAVGTIKENELFLIIEGPCGYLDEEYKMLSSLILMRNKRKMTQKQLANKMGTTQSALSRFEIGSVNPSVKFLKKIAAALNAKLSIRFVD